MNCCKARLICAPNRTADWEFISRNDGTASRIPDCAHCAKRFVNEWGDRFRRAAAARKYHHARRGGLVEHTAQMMRVAKAIAPLYPQLNLDLLIAGILFHDSGKLWENQFSETGFVMGYDELGELVGHISIGLEIVNSLWRKLSAENADVVENLLAVIGRRAPASPASDWFASWREGIGFTG